MKPIREMGRADLAAFVQEHLRSRGIDVVLCGGACVSIYSQGKYVSMDLDMVHIGLTPPKDRLLTGMLKIISPTDCVKDRLTWFYHDNDRQCLNQAILVARENQIDLKEIERWSAGEGMSDEFEQIKSQLGERKA